MKKHASINRIYRLVWNRVRHAWQVAPETARGQGKRSGTVGVTPAEAITGIARLGRRGHLSALSRSLWLAGLLGTVAGNAYAQATNALPTNGTVTSGDVVIGSATASGLTVDQTSDRAIIEWQSFNIGRDVSVTFRQPSTQAATLNRVVSNQASQIMGRLNANGQVYLVNGAGILFGHTAQVNVGSLVASTLEMTDADFMAGRDRFIQGADTGEIVNRGDLTADQGGKVALIGAKVSNEGYITTRSRAGTQEGGDVVLAAGQTVELTAGANGRLRVAVDAAEISTLIRNTGTISTEGGQIVLTAQGANALASAVVSNSGILEAQSVAASKGRILLVADTNRNGRVEVDGVLRVSSRASGVDGGEIDTRGATVAVLNSASIDTRGLLDARAGNWTLAAPQIAIGAGTTQPNGSGLSSSKLQSLLNTTSVSLETVAGGTGNGDIKIDSAITWNADTALNLYAQGNVVIDAPITARAAKASVSINHGGANRNGVTTPAANSNYVVNAPIALKGAATELSINGESYTLIRDMAGFRAINPDAGGRYALAHDIDAAGTTYTLALAGLTTLRPFDGTLAGLGNTVSNLTIQQGNENNAVGLFGYTGSSSLLRDLRLTNVSVSGRNINQGTGALVGNHAGTITNVHTAGSITATGSGTGGMVGIMTNNSQLIDSSASAAVLGSNNTGGLVGHSSNGSITNSHATGNVRGEANAGGLVGMQINGRISGSWTNNSVAGLLQVGGLAGLTQHVNVTTSHSLGDVQASTRAVGGLIGLLLESTLEDSYSSGTVRGSTFVGGAVGEMLGGSVRDVYSSADVLGDHYVGGLIGLISNGGVTRAYANGTVMGRSIVGGLIGEMGNATLSAAWASGKVVGQRTVGGLIGSTGINATLASSYWDAQTTGQAMAVGNLRATNVSNILSLTDANRYARSGYQHLGTWQETAPGTGVWIASDGAGRAWVMFDGATRPFLYREHSDTIRNAHQLQLMAAALGANYTLANDIDASATRSSGSGSGSGMWSSQGFVPIGSQIHQYTGVLDGRGNVVRDLYINSTHARVGLIGSGGRTSSIRNIGLIGADIRGGSFVGGLAGTLIGTLSNSYVHGRVSSPNGAVGGLVGELYETTVDHVHMDGIVEGRETLGGLIGVMTRSSMRHAYAAGTVRGTGEIGGLVGRAQASSIDNAHASNVVVGNEMVGGVAGSLRSNSSLGQAVYWSSTQSGASLDTGLMQAPASTAAANVNNQHLSHTVYGNLGTWSQTALGSGVWVATDADGVKQWVMFEGSTRPFLYSEYNTRIHNAHQLQLVGLDLTAAYTLANDIDASATGVTAGRGSMWSANGFLPLGNGVNTEFSGVLDGNYHVVRGLTIDRDTAHVGLIGATTSDAVVRRIGLEGGRVKGSAVVGALVGRNRGDISESYSGLDVHAIERAGGLVGQNYGTISRSFSQGSVNANLWFVGGLVGEQYDGGVIDQSYTTAYVNTSSNSGNVGYLVGRNVGGTILESYYANTDAQGNAYRPVGQQLSYLGLGKTHAELSQAATFANWDVSSVGGTATTWRTIDGQGGPLLRGFLKNTFAIVNDGSKVYDGTNTIEGESSYVIANPKANGTAAFQSLAGSDAGAYDLRVVLKQGLSGYDLVQSAGTYTITPKSITVGGTTGESTYGDASGFGVGFMANGLVAGQDLNVLTGLSAGTPIDNETGAGQYDTSVTGTLTNGNYTISSRDLGQWNVKRKQIVVSAEGGESTYGDRSINNPGISAEGLVNGQDVSVLTGLSNSFGIDATTHAGTHRLTVSGDLLADSNYEVIGRDIGTWTVNRKQISVAAVGGHSTYGDVVANNPGFTVEGLVNGQDESVLTGLSNSFGIDNTTRAGTHTLTVEGQLDDASNYEIVGRQDGSWLVNRKQISVAANGGQSTYGDAVANNPGFTVEGLVNGQDESVLTGLSNSFGIDNTTRAGTHTLTVEGQLDDASNYEIVSIGQGQWVVNRKALQVTANDAEHMAGTAYSGGNGVRYDGFVNGESASALTGLLAYGGTAQGAREAGRYSIAASGLISDNYDIQYRDGVLNVAALPPVIEPPAPVPPVVVLPNPPALPTPEENPPTPSRQQELARAPLGSDISRSLNSSLPVFVEVSTASPREGMIEVPTRSQLLIAQRNAESTERIVTVPGIHQPSRMPLHSMPEFIAR